MKMKVKSRNARALAGALAALMLAASLRGATIVFDLAKLTGFVNNRQIIVSLATDPLAITTNIVFNTPLKLQPTNGTITTVLLPANYWVAIDNVPTRMFMPVPDSTNTYNAIDLITDGLKHLIVQTNYVTIQNVLGWDSGPQSGILLFDP